MSNKNIKLEKSIDALSNIVEISKYVNAYFCDDNLFGMINDMILGILGVNYSTIFILEDGDLNIKASNIEHMKLNLTSIELMNISNEREFILNSESSIKQIGNGKVDIHSIMGIPIILRTKFIGYILVEHKMYNFMTTELKVFLTSISNQIAIIIENSFLYRELENSTKTDALMKIYNRKYFFDFIEKVVEKNYKKKFAVVMIDIDNFKKVNDTYGHQFGDEVLKNTAKVISKWKDKDDILARYGGEELIMYIPDFQNNDSVLNKVEVIRNELENSKVNFEGICKNITASFGIAFYPEESTDINKLIKLADDLLYESKKQSFFNDDFKKVNYIKK
ncbi:sensor domain-containing diguanylate cyclase [uncultured Clostridium sp.]|uniref:sensor domain-containing diguanylate cyclase n=1 Tax=uncultured Clostridium sp. TaxID=59620 RepID=UPI0025F4BD04|nr:sensor domain-containing diguanylate cyclase [uncultured Clostridium sp.]